VWCGAHWQAGDGLPHLWLVLHLPSLSPFLSHPSHQRPHLSQPSLSLLHGAGPGVEHGPIYGVRPTTCKTDVKPTPVHCQTNPTATFTRFPLSNPSLKTSIPSLTEGRSNPSLNLPLSPFSPLLPFCAPSFSFRACIAWTRVTYHWHGTITGFV
jgi:hypothetical protein